MKRLKKNNKGFSLVELIAAVAILAVVVTPLLHSFVTSSKVSNRATEISEATLAGKNILETVDARPLSEFQQVSDSNSAAMLLGDDSSGTTITPIGQLDIDGDIVPDEKGGFDVALQNVKVGNALYDAKVEFSRGDEDAQFTVNGETKNSTSHGLYLINGEKIAKYSGMDGVFCQTFYKTGNPDYMVDEVYKTEAKTNVKMPADYISRQRFIRLEAYKDSDGLVWARLSYTYQFKYYELDNEGFKTEIVKAWPDSPSPGAAGYAACTYSYSIFPGGFEPRNKDGSVSIYIMYYPDYYADYTDETNYTVKCRKDTIDIYNIADEGYDVDLRVFLYKQNPINYYSDNYEKFTDTQLAGTNYKADVTMFKPDSFEITEGEQRETLLYTNVDEKLGTGEQLPAGDFRFILAQARYEGFDPDDPDWDPTEEGAPTIYYPIDTPPLDISLDLVRKDKEIRIYNIKITLYKKNSATISTQMGEDDTVITSCVFSGNPIYVVEGTKTP